MFEGAALFNINIASWKTDQVTDMAVSCFFQIFTQMYSFYIILLIGHV